MNTGILRNANVSVTEQRATALIAFALGAVLLFVVGFAPSQAIHNAAHDTRHILSFPCH